MTEFKGKNYTAVLDKENGTIVSLTGQNKTNFIDKSGNFGAVCYTENNAENVFTHRFVEGRKEPALVLQDKIYKLSPAGITDNSAKFKGDKAGINYKFNDDEILITLTANSKDFSAVGLQLDVDFIDKDQQGDYRSQLLPVYPYSSSDGKVKFYGMRNVLGEWVLIYAKDFADGWRINYIPDMPHVLNGFQFLKHFDRRLKNRDNDGEFSFTVSVSLHSSMEQMLEFAETKLNILLPRLKVSAVPVGSEIFAEIMGSPDNVFVTNAYNEKTECKITFANGVTKVKFTPQKTGFYNISTNLSGKTADATVFSYSNWRDMFIKATDAVKKPYHCDFNLCEGAMWLYSLLIRENMFGKDGICETKIQEFFDENLNVTEDTVTDADIGKIVPFGFTYNGKTYSPYHTYKLERAQNQITQSLCMLWAYKLYGDSKFLNLAKEYIFNIMRDNTNAQGVVTSNLCDEDDNTDYTTVTCLVIGYVDLANYLKSINDSDYKAFETAAIKIADHLIKRGFDFPSEGTQGRHEMEEGSISCTALSLLYVYKHLCKNPVYLENSLKFLQLHDSFCMPVYDVRMMESTLRWWETNWEGDADGSSINAGHAWTIWKAEADFWYAVCKGDYARAVKSYNGYMTNLCKVTESGDTYTCYTPDYITGKPYLNKTVHRYPEHFDYSMPYYMWTRAENTWFKTAGYGFGITLNAACTECDEYYEITPAAVKTERFFIGHTDKPICIKTKSPIEIINCCGKIINIICGKADGDTDSGISVSPVDEKIVIMEGN